MLECTSDRKTKFQWLAPSVHFRNSSKQSILTARNFPRMQNKSSSSSSNRAKYDSEPCTFPIDNRTDSHTWHCHLFRTFLRSFPSSLHMIPDTATIPPPLDRKMQMAIRSLILRTISPNRNGAPYCNSVLPKHI